MAYYDSKKVMESISEVLHDVTVVYLNSLGFSDIKVESHPNLQDVTVITFPDGNQYSFGYCNTVST